MLASLKPTLPKVILAVVLLVLTYWAQSRVWYMFIADYGAHGFPLPFFERWGPCQPGDVCSDFKLLPLVGDVVIWYAVSAGIVSLVRRGRGRKEST